jgi:hypothetical protein
MSYVRQLLLSLRMLWEELHYGVSSRMREVVCLIVAILLCGCNRSLLYGKDQRHPGDSHNKLATMGNSLWKKSTLPSIPLANWCMALGIPSSR